MESIGEIWRRAQFFFQRRQLERELEEEMRFHLEMKAQSNREEGMRDEEAFDAARRKFGNATLVSEDSRAAWTWGAAERFAKDVRVCLRMLRKDLSFTGLAVLTLGLGIGATTAVFSVVNGVLLNPLPYKDPGRLVVLRQIRKQSGVVRTATSYPNFQDWKDQSRSFEAMTAQSVPTAITISEPEPDVVPAIGVDRNFFSLLGVKAARGRVFVDDDFKPGSAPVNLITWQSWQRRFGGDPAIIGRKVAPNGRARIVGVLPPQYRQPRLDAEGKDPELLIPMDFSMIRMREAGILSILGRMKPGVPLDRARAEMAGIGARLAREYRANQGTELETVPLSEVLVGRVRKPLWLLLGAVLALLLCACVNMANLLLARSIQRQQEFAIRAALGGRPGLLFAQVVTEGLVLSGLGALVGIALAGAGVRWLMLAAGGLIPRGEQVAVDGNVLLFTLALSSLTGLLFACVPAFVCSRGDLNEALKTGGKASGAAALGRTRSFLVTAEVALAVVLLAGAGLLLRSFWSVLSIDMGYQTRNVLTADIALPSGGGAHRGVTFLSEFLGRVGHLPGVEAAGAAGTVPLALSTTPELTFDIVNSPAPVSGERRSAAVIAADPGYFRTMRIALRRGRRFDAGDGPQSAPVALVNEALVRRYFPNEDPIGKVLNIGGATRNIASGAARVVGVVADVRQTDVLAEPKPQIWKPHTQCQWPFMTIALRTSGDPNALAGPLRAELRALDRGIPLANVRTAEGYYSDALAERRVSMFLLGALAVLALVLSATGVYGMIAYSVSQRRREIGIRMALGAQPGHVVSMIVGQGVVVAIVGLAIGTAAALAASRLLAGVLYGIAPNDPFTYGGVAALFTGVAVAASYFPGRRATRANPLAALRAD